MVEKDELYLDKRSCTQGRKRERRRAKNYRGWGVTKKLKKKNRGGGGGGGPPPAAMRCEYVFAQFKICPPPRIKMCALTYNRIERGKIRPRFSPTGKLVECTPPAHVGICLRPSVHTKTEVKVLCYQR